MRCSTQTQSYINTVEHSKLYLGNIAKTVIEISETAGVVNLKNKRTYSTVACTVYTVGL